MGAFPSHDTPELFYTTLVPRPSTDTHVEICLVPLLPRFFNDTHKKAKRKLNDILSRTGVDQPTPGAIPSGAATPGSATASAPPKRAEPTGSGPIVDCLIASTDPYFLIKAKDAIISREALLEYQQQMKNKSGTSDAAAVPAETSAKESSNAPQQPHTAQQHTSLPLVRPVPFAVCILDPDNSSSDSFTPAKPHSLSNRQHQNLAANGGNVLMIKGHRLQLVGLISCCLSRPVQFINPTTFTKTQVLGGGGSPSSSTPGMGDSKKPCIPVVLDVIFDDVEAHGYLAKHVVLLASLAFRKQFVNACALHYPANDKDVEASFDYYMERLQLRLVLQRNNYRDLRMFYSHYALLDMIKELRMQEAAPTHFSLYETHLGEHGLEVTFSNKFLGAWLRYVESKMQVDCVKGQHIRCNASECLQECQRLIQERHDSGVFLEEEEEDERLYGGSVLAATLKQWLFVGSQLLLQQQAQFAAAQQMMMYPPASSTAAATGFWSQLPPMVMGMPPGWTPNVMPFNTAATPIPLIPGQQQQFIIPGGRPQLCYTPPQTTIPATSAFPSPAGMQVVPSTPSSYGVAAAPGMPPQQIVYVLPGGQIYQPSTIPHTATAPVTFPPAPTPPVYFAQPPSYGIPYSSYMFPQLAPPQPAPAPPE
ncbi:hypothetical protein TraAM80_04396 [Trypanosoma rangeli]|uniref:Uncharacterized protein n=1 Tax=Trypanosoma rangeli TaxID=5698 RepID=A0A422NJM3_TRYRA|nr:uncharacterized protein TraAM80_04396 [Trypanosoma rangeli]RNF05675.1 hypothetical protein TraAM80_04396 [Trypanosoma rangeli]|eukprot:RNF05675.1 hypothetical protein TraAM80_04396 [Trypanosoma rangeli]